MRNDKVSEPPCGIAKINAVPQALRESTTVNSCP
jgi:hypothetical protein